MGLQNNTGILVCFGHGDFRVKFSSGTYLPRLKNNRRFDAKLYDASNPRGHWVSTFVDYDDLTDTYFLDCIGYVFYDPKCNGHYLDGYGYLYHNEYGLRVRLSGN